MKGRLSTGWLRTIIRRPGFWFLLVTLILITIPHYGEHLGQPSFLTDLTGNLGLDRHAIERILYMAPIIWAGFMFGQKGAFIVSVVALACMLPRALLISDHPSDATFESIAVFVVGNLVALTFYSLNKERVRRVQLDALNEISGVASQSLELKQILNSSIESLTDVMKVDTGLVFLVDSDADRLVLTAYRGVSDEFVEGIRSMRLGEGYNGKVAQTGEALLVEDASTGPSETRELSRAEGLQSQMIVPMVSKGKVMGTLCVAVHGRRRFHRDELELLTAIGNQIGVAVENADLYEQEHQISGQLRQSEARYRELFESANDAIWTHDLAGNITAANRATAKLTGYTTEELTQTNVSDFLSPESLLIAGRLRAKLLLNEPVEQPYEQRITMRDGTEATLTLTTSLLTENGKAIGFQHMARDVTEERAMQENLHYYVEQITKAQEEERKRIARELHDETIQALVVLSRRLDQLGSGDEGIPEDKRAPLDNLREQVNNIVQDVRRLSQDLRPPTLDRLGLLPALQWMASNVGSRSGIAVEVEISGSERRLPPDVELVLFRIAQEALSNVWRHSKATAAKITVDFREAEIKLAVTDSGEGFALPGALGDLARDGKLGLAGMQERARLLGGTLTLESAPGSGTAVSVIVPAQ